MLFRSLASHWKPYLDNLHVCMTDATCYESHMRFPTDMKLLWESLEWLYRHICRHCRELGIRRPRNKYRNVAELYSFMDVQEMTWKRKKLLSLMVQMDNYSDYLLLWSPRDKKLWYLDIEHEEFHPLAKWDDFIADPGRYLNGMIEGEFEE